MFANVVDLDIDPMGRIWIADAQQYAIRVFDPDGKFIRTIGRKGGGPSEFAGLAGMDWADDGRLWVMDGANTRYAVYDTSGTLVTTHPRTVGMTTVPWPGGFDAEGRLYDTGVVPDEAGGVKQVVIRFGENLQPRDTFEVPPFKSEFFELVSSDGRNRNRITVPFTGTQLWRVDPDGFVWTAVTDDYRFNRQALDGDTVKIVDREYTPTPVSNAEMAQVLENYKWFVQQGGKIDRSRIPDKKPAIATFFFDDAGYMWVLPTVGEDESFGFDVFEKSGRYLGRVPSEARIVSVPTPVIRGDRLVGLTVGEDGTQSVVSMRIRKSGTSTP